MQTSISRCLLGLTRQRLAPLLLVSLLGALVVAAPASARADSLLHTLSDPTLVPRALFGYSVAHSGARVVVGAPLDQTGETGSAYVYDLASATPTVPVATLNNPSPVLNDYFGNSVAISGTRVVVGAYLDDTGVIAAGSAYVYDLGQRHSHRPRRHAQQP